MAGSPKPWEVPDPRVASLMGRYGASLWDPNASPPIEDSAEPAPEYQLASRPGESPKVVMPDA